MTVKAFCAEMTVQVPPAYEWNKKKSIVTSELCSTENAIQHIT